MDSPGRGDFAHRSDAERDVIARFCGYDDRHALAADLGRTDGDIPSSPGIAEAEFEQRVQRLARADLRFVIAEASLNSGALDEHYGAGTAKFASYVDELTDAVTRAVVRFQYVAEVAKELSPDAEPNPETLDAIALAVSLGFVPGKLDAGSAVRFSAIRQRLYAEIVGALPIDSDFRNEIAGGVLAAVERVLSEFT
jgi:hypothetical protein